jgi:hypothetical protein
MTTCFGLLGLWSAALFALYSIRVDPLGLVGLVTSVWEEPLVGFVDDGVDASYLSVRERYAVWPL